MDERRTEAAALARPQNFDRSRRATSFFAAHAPRVMASLAASSPVFLAGTARASAPPRRARLPPVRLGRPVAPRAGARVPRSVGTSFDLLALDSGADGATRAAADAFERVDDVVMGGVSSSVIAPDLAGRDCLVWAGKCRVEGGGFTGCRSVALKNPMDLSAYDGIALTCGFESDDEPERRTWKATVRTQNDRGEMVYQATFVPPVATRSGTGSDERPPEIRIPWDAFRLVRGPTVVPDVPPLSADECAKVYGLGLIMSRFGPRGPMPDFREGPFRLALHGYGVYSQSEDAPSPATLASAAADNAGKRASENRGTRNVVTFVLAPLIKLVFSEKGRRRRRAREILKERYGMSDAKARFGFGQALKKTRMGGNGAAAAAEGAAQLARDAVAGVLTLPLRGVFILLSKLARLARAVRGQKQLPKMK